MTKQIKSVVQQISSQIVKKPEPLSKNKTSQAHYFYSGISFGLLAQNAILQRTSDFMPLEILSVSACVNFHLSCEFLIKFILTKSNLEFDENSSLFSLFLLMPKIIQEQIIPNLTVETKHLSQLPSSTNLLFYQNNKSEILQIFHFFNSFQKRIEAIAMDIEQNNLSF